MILRHSGKLGDIIYSLAATQVYAGQVYLINANGERLAPDTACSILSLLEAQTYIARADLWNGEPVDRNLDDFRALDPVFNNLADCHLRSLGLPLHLRDSPWITVRERITMPGKDILFARSRTFHGMPGVMHGLYARLGHRGAFVGTESEHQAFCHGVGPLPYAKTNDLLSLAQLIAGCRLFVGNQSCPLAIAEALNVPAVHEVCHGEPNCIFYRHCAYPIWHVNQLPSALTDITSRLGPP